MPKRQFERLEQLTQHVAAASLGPSPAAAASAGKQYDLVLANGRVIDPESGTDAVLNVGIIGDRVAALGPADAVSPADAAAVRDCTGLIVAPGFIDLHAHGQNNESARLQACDGVTTHLELEVGTWPVESFLAEREALGAVINFGTSVGHIPARAAAITGSAVPLSIANDPCCMIEAKQFEGTEATGHRET
jgi:imidazolonepropionase-like amidohydrolase